MKVFNLFFADRTLKGGKNPVRDYGGVKLDLISANKSAEGQGSKVQKNNADKYIASQKGLQKYGAIFKQAQTGSEVT